MTLRRAAAVVIVLLALSVQASAHAGLRFSSPLEGSTLGAAPSQLQLTFAEKPEATLATVRVIDTNGVEYQVGRPETVGGDPLTLIVKVRAMPRDVYTVHWRVVSAVDGHASAGAFVFGVLMAPQGPAVTTATTISVFEATGRSVFLIGVVLAIGVATSRVFGFGGAAIAPIAIVSWLVTAIGLALLAFAQVRAAQTSLTALAGTMIGRALIARAIAVAIMLIGTICIRGRNITRSIGTILLAIGSCGAVVVHAAAGHAAAGRWPMIATIATQSVHIVMAGAWIGGLVVLVAELKSAPPRARAIAAFSNLAAVALVTVAISGVVRAYHEIDSWSSLFGTTYGVLALAKIVLLAILAGLGGLNRWRNIRVASTDAAPLRRTAIAEINLAMLATIVAGVLGSLPPPAGAASIAGLSATGSDFATTVRSTFTAVSNQPGPNRFTVRVEDYDSGRAVDAQHVTLQFTPIDDPSIAPTTLSMSSNGDGRFSATGAQLAFPGRWRIEMLIESGRSSVSVPVEVEARGLPQFTSILRPSGAPPTYIIESNKIHSVSITIDPEKVGVNQLQISFENVLLEPLPVNQVVVTLQHGTDPPQVLETKQTDRARVTATATFGRGLNRVVVTARTDRGERVRANLEVVTNSSN